MPKQKLTQTFVNSVTCDTTKSKVDYFDMKVHGLLLKVLPSGKKSFYLRYKNDRSKTVEKVLSSADATVMKLSDARFLAAKYLGQIAMGDDPFVQKKLLKQVPLLSDFINDRYLPYVKTYKRSWDTDVSLIKNHIMPCFGHYHMDEITKDNILAFITTHSKTHKAASVNRVVVMIRYIFNLSIRWEIAGMTKNPTTGIPLLEENNKRERYLTAHEADILVSVLNTSENKMLRYIVPMLILTGARKSEVLKAKWEDFNFELRVWRIPMSKSGKPRYVPISEGVMRLLQAIPQTCDYVFANPKTCKPYATIWCSWNTARKSVNLADVRIHDLRHSFASFLVNNGRSLYEVQCILGHTQIKTTQRYAHLSNDSLLAAANEISKAIPIFSAQLASPMRA